MKAYSYIKRRINSGTERSVVVKKNIFASFIVKGLSILTSLLLVPVTLNQINSEKYGIWITIYSVVTWFNMMDIGLGNGFRNKFANAIALKKNEDAKDYLQTLYTVTGLIAIAFFVGYLLISPMLNWASILNVSTNFDENIDQILLVVFSLFAVQLILKNITTVLLALQKTALSNLIIFGGNLLALVTVYFLGVFNIASLFSISLSFMLAPIIVWFITSVLFYNSKLSYLGKFGFSVNGFKEIMNLGIKFFFIQIASIVMFSSGNFIITRLYGPSEVTPYNIAYRLFAASITFFAIIKSPFWTAFTEANAQKDFKWMKSSLKKLIQIWLGFVIITIMVLFASNLIYRVWIGNDIIIPFNLSIQFAVYALLISWTGIFAQFLNGIGIIKLQLFIAAIQCIVVVPLGILFAKTFQFHTMGIILSINLNLAISSIILYIQTNKIINKTAKGIWNQ